MNRTVGSDVFVATGAFGRVAEDASARGRLVSPAPRAGRPETEMYSGLQPTRGSPRFAVLAVLRRHPQRIQHGICVTFLRPCAVRMVFHQSPSLPWGCPTTRLTGLLWPWPDPMMPAQTRRQPLAVNGCSESRRAVWCSSTAPPTCSFHRRSRSGRSSVSAAFSAA